jgi:SAM dependent carboxyl methyltransferase
MSNERGISHAVMEGEGSYNRYAKLPADGAALALPLLEKAIREVELDSGDEAIVIADYGSSQGKNSLAPMQVAIRGLRKRIGPNRAISVFHIDQPSNDFNSLFEVLHADPNRYVVDEHDVYPAAIGKSFYEKVLPLGSVHLGWSSYAAVWLSRVPALIPGHFISICSTGMVRAEFERQAAQDWETFLSLRARELRPGGRLLVVLPGIADDGSVGLEPLFDHANAVLEEMVDDGAITPEERSRMVLRAHPRRKRDLLAPFAGNRKFQQLTVEDFAMSGVSDAAWDQYQLDGDKQALATKRALFFRSIFVPSLACALSPARAGNGAAPGIFADELEQRLKRRLANQPAAMPSFVQTILLAKKEGRP